MNGPLEDNDAIEALVMVAKEEKAVGTSTTNPATKDSVFLIPVIDDNDEEEEVETEEGRDEEKIYLVAEALIDSEKRTDANHNSVSLDDIGLSFDDDDNVTATPTSTTEEAEETMANDMGEKLLPGVEEQPRYSTVDDVVSSPKSSSKNCGGQEHSRKLEETYNKLNQYESRRRSKYVNKLQTLKSEWQTTCSLIQLGVEETLRTERIVTATIIANNAYADAMKAIYEDVYLDDDGNTMMSTDTSSSSSWLIGSTTAWKQSRLQAKRSTEDYTDSLGTDKCNSTQGGGEEQQRGGVLGCLIDTQNKLSDRFNENAQHLKSDMQHDLADFRQDLQSQVNDVDIELGNELLSKLDTIEKQIQDSWYAFESTASTKRCETVVANIGNDSSFFDDNGNDSSSRQLEQQGAAATTTTTVDPWILEMNYRIACAEQESIFSKVIPELQSMSNSLIQIECNRREEMPSFLLGLVPRQLPNNCVSVQHECLEKMSSALHYSSDQETVEQDISSTIQKQQKLIQRASTEHRSTILNRSRRTNVNDQDLNIDIPPLEANLTTSNDVNIVSYQIFERQVKTLAGYGDCHWQKCIALLTVDQVLHLFDIPEWISSDEQMISSLSDPNEIFSLLKPSSDRIPTIQTVNDYYEGKSSKALLQDVTPAESMYVPNCSLELFQENYSLEITAEDMICCNKGGAGKARTRKVLMRTGSEDELDYLIGTLFGDTTPPLSPSNTAKDGSIGMKARSSPNNLSPASLYRGLRSSLSPYRNASVLNKEEEQQQQQQQQQQRRQEAEAEEEASEMRLELPTLDHSAAAAAAAEEEEEEKALSTHFSTSRHDVPSRTGRLKQLLRAPFWNARVAAEC